MANYKGVASPYAEQPSKDRNKKASVDFSVGDKGGKGASWKGGASPAGSLPKERKATISASNIHDVKADRKSSMGASPGK